MKFNYDNKNFEKYGFVGRKEDIENHFKLREYTKYKYLFCNEDIQNMLKIYVNLELLIIQMEINILEKNIII